MIAAIQHVTLCGELSVHGAGLLLASAQKFLKLLTEALWDYLDIEFKMLAEVSSSSSFTSIWVS